MYKMNLMQESAPAYLDSYYWFLTLSICAVGIAVGGLMSLSSVESLTNNIKLARDTKIIGYLAFSILAIGYASMVISLEPHPDGYHLDSACYRPSGGVWIVMFTGQAITGVYFLLLSACLITGRRGSPSPKMALLAGIMFLAAGCCFVSIYPTYLGGAIIAGGAMIVTGLLVHNIKQSKQSVTPGSSNNPSGSP
jgi:hypothetical protein